MDRMTLVIAAALASPVPAVAGERMTPDAVRAYLTESPRRVTMGDGRVYRITYGVDGTTELQIVGSGFRTAGRWRLSAGGYCTQYGDRPEACYALEKNGDRADIIQNGARVGECERF